MFQEALAGQIAAIHGIAGRDAVFEVGGLVDIATSCGLGRRIPEQALRAVDRMRVLLD